MSLTRRRLLQSSAASLLAAGLWPGRLFADDAATGDFTFIIINDLHYMDAECGHFFEKVVDKMKATPGVEFVLINGDVTDKGIAASQAAQRDIFKGLGVPYHVVPGNHDWITDDDRSGFDSIFPNQTNYLLDHRGWQFVALDTTDGTRYHETTIHDDTLHWLDDNLPKLDKSKPTILWTHFPLAPHAKYRPKNAAAVLERLKAFNVQSVYDGHYHGYTEEFVNGVSVTTNKCCAFKRWNHDGTPEKGYFLVKAKDGKVTREFVRIDFAGMPPMPPKKSEAATKPA